MTTNLLVTLSLRLPEITDQDMEVCPWSIFQVHVINNTCNIETNGELKCDFKEECQPENYAYQELYPSEQWPAGTLPITNLLG